MKTKKLTLLSMTNAICTEAAMAGNIFAGQDIQSTVCTLTHQAVYEHLRIAKRAGNGQKRHYKDYTKDLLKHFNIDPSQTSGTPQFNLSIHLYHSDRTNTLHQAAGEEREILPNDKMQLCPLLEFVISEVLSLFRLVPYMFREAVNAIIDNIYIR